MGYEIVRGIIKVFLRLVFRIKVEGDEKLLSDGGVVLASNHKSNWDPVVIAAFSPRKLSFLAKSELFKNKLLGGLLKKFGAFPIERGKGDIGAIKMSLKLLKEGNALLMFPEGTRVKDGSNSAVKTGVVMLSERSGVPIAPVYISGKYRLFGKITVKFGDVIYLDKSEEKPTREQMKETAEEVMKKIRDLKVDNL